MLHKRKKIEDCLSNFDLTNPKNIANRARKITIKLKKADIPVKPKVNFKDVILNTTYPKKNMSKIDLVEILNNSLYSFN